MKQNRICAHTLLRGLCPVLLGCLLLGVLAVFPAIASEGNLSVDKTHYEVGEPIMVTANGSNLDWAGIWPAGSGDVGENALGSAIYWYYVADGHTPGASVHLQAQIDATEFRPEYRGLPAGHYEIYLCANNTYLILEKLEIVIGDPAPETDPPETEAPPAVLREVVTDKESYEVGEDIYVTATGVGNDWVGLWAADDVIASPAEGGDVCIYWYYLAMDDHISGNPVCMQSGYDNAADRPDLAGLPAGRYKVAVLADGGYTSVAETYITIGDPDEKPEPKPNDPVGDEKLSVDRTVYAEGKPIMVTATGDGDDWVGIYLATDVVEPEGGNMPAVYWYYIDKEGHTSGETFEIQKAEHSSDKRPTLVDLPAGEYKVVICRDGGYIPDATVYFTISEQNPDLYTDKTVYSEGDTIYVTATGKGNDWVGIWVENDVIAPPAEGGAIYLYWYYVAMEGHVSGTAVPLQSTTSNGELRPEYAYLPAGRYQIALLPDGGYVPSDIIHIEIKGAEATPPKPPKAASFVSANVGVDRADGTIRITTADGAQPTSYTLKWAGPNGLLEGAPALESIPYTGQEVTTYTIPEGTAIPEGADRILIWSVRGELTSDSPAAVMIRGGEPVETTGEETTAAEPAVTQPDESDPPPAVETPAETPAETSALGSESAGEAAPADQGCGSALLSAFVLLLVPAAYVLMRRKSDGATL